MKRSGRLRPVSVKQRRKNAEWQAAREVALSRAHYWPQCELVGFGADHEHWGGIEVHHRLRRSQGGGHDLDNLVVLCSAAHAYVHKNPEWAYGVGLLIRSGAVA